MTVEAVRRLGEISRTYESTVIDYATQTRDAAVAEADYRRLKAVFITRSRVDGKLSIAAAESAADADEEVSAACMRYKLTTAAAEATKARLRQLQAAVDTGRSFLASEREADRISASGVTP